MAKILLVEDDNNLREIYEARLQAEGYEIVSAQDGEAALAIAKKEQPDLVISDVMMPRISGFEMLDILRNTEGLKDVKVIMLTALGQAEDKTRADSLGADRYLVKSQVTLEDIVKTASDLLAGAPSMPAAPAAVVPTATIPVSMAPAEPITPPTPTVSTPMVPSEPATATPPPATEPADAAIPAPEPIATPAAPVVTEPVVSTPIVAPEPAVGSTTTASAQVDASAPQAAASEQAAIQAQVNAFASTPVTTVSEPTAPAAALSEPAMVAPAEPTPAEPVAVAIAIESAVPVPTPTTEPTPTAPVATNDNGTNLADAVKDLISSTEPAAPVTEPTTADQPAQAPEPVAPSLPAPEAPAQAPVTATLPTPSIAPTSAPSLPTPVTPESTAAVPTESATTPAMSQHAAPAIADGEDSVTMAKKKIISPIATEGAQAPTDLNTLLAKEGIDSMDEPATAPGTPPPNTLPHPPGHVISPNPVNTNGQPVDPNSISL